MSVERDLRRDMLKRRAQQDKLNEAAVEETAAQHEAAVKLSAKMDTEMRQEAEASTEASIASSQETHATQAKKTADRVSRRSR